jgi:DNA-binding NtrC family response regulator
VKSGRFREDLYYRLNVVRLRLPPLRERREDIPEFAEHFLRKYCAETGKTVAGISSEAMALLRGHRWPGNVRELENAIERAVVLGDGAAIAPADLGLRAAVDGDSAPSGDHPTVGPFHESVEAFKHALIRTALAQAGGNQTRAAEMLGLQRTYLARLIKNFGLREHGS